MYICVGTLRYGTCTVCVRALYGYLRFTRGAIAACQRHLIIVPKRGDGCKKVITFWVAVDETELRGRQMC